MDNEILKLWQEKKELTDEMLKLTEMLSLSGLEEDADVYATFVSKRQTYIDQFQVVDNQLKQEPYLSVSPEVQIEIDSLSKQMQGSYQEMLRIDEANRPIIENVLKDFRGEIKKFNQAKNFKNMYSQDSGAQTYRKINTRK